MGGTATKPRRVKGRREAAARQRARRNMLVVAVLAVVAIALVWWGISGDGGTDDAEPDRPVEQFMHVHGLAVPSWADGDVLLSTHEGLIRISGDDQQQWRYISEQPHDFMGFAANPDQDGVLYSSGHPAPGSGLPNPIGFMLSEDGGATWEPRSLQGEVDFHTMAVSPADGQVVYGWFRDQLFVSRDAGGGWEKFSADALAQSGGAVSLAGHPDNPDEVWAATPAGLLRSRDGGRSWEPVRAGQTTAVVLDPGDGDRILAYTAEGLMESRDGGDSWTALGLSLEEDAAGYMAVHAGDSDVVYVGTYGQKLLRTHDGGSSWTELAVDGTPQR